MSSATPTHPLVAGRYQLRARVGAGGMAAVYRATDLALDRTVAVKLLHAHLVIDDHAQQRFESEARYAAGLAHPNLVTIFDFGIDERPYIVMEWVDGGSLRDRMTEGTLPPAEMVHIVDAVCAGLAVAHRAGLVHRDVKPENILLAPNGPKVADFGIARSLADPNLTPTGRILGSPHYLAPEVVRGVDPTPASDQYAVGVLMFELLTGRVPLPAAGPEAILIRHAVEPVPPPSRLRPELSADVDVVIARATAMNPYERYPSVVALADAFRATLDVTRVRPGPFETTVAVPRRRRRRIVGWAALAVLIVAVLSALSDDRSTSAADAGDSAADAADSGDSAADAAPAEPEAPTIDDEVADGSLAFTVTDFGCAGRRLGTVRASGRFCRVELVVTNIGQDPHAMVAGMQRLIDAHDREHKPDDAATVRANWGRDLKIWLGELNPGQTVSGTLVFDMPAGAKPVAVRLHDGPLSRGALVRLR